jgi:serine/threonine-protein kinase PknG
MVPRTSRGYTESRRQRAEVLLDDGGDIATLDEAMRTVDKAAIDARQRNEFAVRILEAALERVTNGPPPADDARVGDHPATQRGLREGVEAALRSLARDTDDLSERVALVNRANAVRPWSMT